MKHVLLKSTLMSFAVAAAVTVSAQHSTPDASPRSAAADRAMFDRSGKPRSPRAQWVYRIVAKWGPHVQEAYRTDPRRWADSMAQVFAKASPDALQRAAEARTFAAMNDALLALSSPAGTSAPRSASGAKALGDPDRDLVYVPVTPCRILDTRIAGGPIAANTARDFDFSDATSYAIQGGDTGSCNVGDKGSIAAAALNVTVVQPGAPGYITAYPHMENRPTAATANYTAGDIRNSLAIVRMDQSLATYEFTVYSFAQTHLVADVIGYFSRPSGSIPDCIELASVSKGINRTTFIDSPSCPVGYAIMGGDCKTTQYNQYTPASLASSYSEQGKHTCVWYGSNSAAVSIARCCRIVGQ